MLRVPMRVPGCLILCLSFIACEGPIPSDSLTELAEQVRSTEEAFAATMARRDLVTFASFLSDESVFVGSESTLRGASAIRAGWAPYFEGDEAPFSWVPETVEVLQSGVLALSTGPVFDSTGKRVGTFNSIWRREADGQWKVVFDKGCPPCDCSVQP